MFEKALLQGFWENEDNVSSESIEVLVFNKTLEGMNSVMKACKSRKVLQTLKDEIPMPKVCSNHCVKKSLLFSDSFGIIAAKLNCLLKNINFLFGGSFECQNLWIR